MSEECFKARIASLTDEQWEAVRVCIMAERRLRVIYPRDPAAEPALSEAYRWALNAYCAPVPAILS